MSNSIQFNLEEDADDEPFDADFAAGFEDGTKRRHESFKQNSWCWLDFRRRIVTFQRKMRLSAIKRKEILG